MFAQKYIIILLSQHTTNLENLIRKNSGKYIWYLNMHCLKMMLMMLFSEDYLIALVWSLFWAVRVATVFTWCYSPLWKLCWVCRPLSWQSCCQHSYRFPCILEKRWWPEDVVWDSREEATENSCRNHPYVYLRTFCTVRSLPSLGSNSGSVFSLVYMAQFQPNFWIYTCSKLLSNISYH